jgi:hypothetical protein
VARFVEYLFSRMETLQGSGFDPKWKEINLAATVPGLVRFPAAQEWLDRAAGSEAGAPQTDATPFRAQAARTAPHSPAEQKRSARKSAGSERQRRSGPP